MYTVKTSVAKRKKDDASTTYISIVEKDADAVSKELGLPSSKDYKLETMLANGHVPSEVPVKGMLDPVDPLERSVINQVEKDTLSLSEIDVTKPKTTNEPTPPKESEPINEPNNE